MIKRYALFAALGAAFLLIIIALPNWLLGTTRMENLASQALSRDVRIDGPVSINLLGGVYITLEDIHIGNDLEEIVVAEKARIGFRFLPLLAGRIRITSIELHSPTINITSPATGFPDPTSSQSVNEPLATLELAELSLLDATVNYVDPQAQNILTATHCDVRMHQLRMLGGSLAMRLRNLSFDAAVSCEEFRQNNYSGSDLAIAAIATQGVISLAPLRMQFLGGHGTGNMQLDFSGDIPRYQVHYVLPQLKLASLLNTLPPAFSAEGLLDLTLNLALHGENITALAQSANGNLFLHGQNLTLTGVDLDEKFEQFESSQNFNLLDAGAFFFAGPLGLLATKGYDFTELLQQSGGRSEIHKLNSDWLISDGIAQADDVAMATRHNLIALNGQLDLVNGLFNSMTLALVDKKGCSLVQQDIGGSFAEPQIEQPNALATIAGPVLNILRQGATFFTDKPCEAFYTGTVPAL